MATEIEPLIMPFDPLWVTTSKREYREAVRRMGEEPGDTKGKDGLTSCIPGKGCVIWISRKVKAPDLYALYGGMFIVGIDTPDGQATYHYDIDPYWGMFRCKELDRAPEWDGHTPEQAIERIGKLTGLIDRATTHLVLDEDGRTCCAKCGCDYLCMSSATYCPDCGAKVAKNG